MPSRRPTSSPKGTASPSHRWLPLTVAEVEKIRATFIQTGSKDGTARVTGFSRDTVVRYLERGDPARGIPPILQGGVVQPAPPGASTAPATPLAAPTPTPQASTPPAGAPGGPGGGATPPRPLPPSLPAPGTLPAPDPATRPSLEHTVPIANAELVRVSRNTRALFSARNRVVAKLFERFQRVDLTGKNAPRLSASERDLLMLAREVRVTAYDVDKLYAREVAILGVTSTGVPGAAVTAEEVPEGDPSDDASVEQLKAELEALLADSPNKGRRRAG